MNIKNLFTDDDAVSPVIGVILMVAITVILAAVIGAFVLDLGGSQEKTPQANFETDYSESSSALDITHTSGDSIVVDRLEVTGTSNSSGSDQVWYEFGSSSLSSGDEVSSGDTVTVEANSGDVIRVVWTAESGDTSSVLNEYEVP
ncbi:type IV pilin [Halobacteriales archaeon QS_9_68_17]|nr:MAG: type IV pilin [Halobacteriales archaeon QS_9_68_17]